MAKPQQQAESLPLLSLPPPEEQFFSGADAHKLCCVHEIGWDKKKVTYVLILIKVISEVPNQKAVEGDQSFYLILFV